MMNEENFPFKMYSESGEGRLVNSRTSDRLMEIVEVISGTVTVFIGTARIENTQRFAWITITRALPFGLKMFGL